MNIILLISLVILSASAILGLYKQFQMLQQNSYYPSRYFKWFKEDYVLYSAFELFASAFIISNINNGHYIYALTVSAVLLILRTIQNIGTHKRSIKKLVFTSRVKRFYAVAVILSLTAIILNILLPLHIGELIAAFGVIIFCCLPLLCFICRFITAPIDKAVTKWYINDAKKILAGHKNLTVIGITGSYGKTTTKFILQRLLSEKYNVVATPQSFNTPMGVVRTIREQLKPQTQIFICEMGAKNVGDIKEICDIVHPDIGIITSVGAQHLETFKSVDNVFKTKFELADAVMKKGCKVFVNGDSAELISRIDKSLYTVYGTGDFDAVAADIGYGKDGSHFTVKSGEDEIKLTTKLLGLHSIINITGTVAVSKALGVSDDGIRFAAASLKPTEHRLEMKPYINGSVMIDDAYNANPEGCIEAVNVLASFDNMKKVIITPGLVELGAKEDEYNKALGLHAGKKCDVIILVGINRSRPIKEGVIEAGFNEENLFVVGSFKEAQSVYSGLADRSTVVLIENDLPDNYLK